MTSFTFLMDPTMTFSPLRCATALLETVDGGGRTEGGVGTGTCGSVVVFVAEAGGP